MAKINSVLISITALLLTTPVYAKRTAHENDCKGKKLPYTTAMKACKSGKYPGKTVVTCNGKGKQKDRRICNSDNNKKGVYINSCSGAATGYTSIDKACKSTKYYGKLLVRCRNGKEKKRSQCSRASKNDKKVVIFEGRCGSAKRIAGRDLLKTCKHHQDKTLVKCRRKGNIWKEVKSMYCDTRKDRAKLRNCSPKERATILSDMKLAESKVVGLVAAVNSQLATNKTMSKDVRKKMKVVLRKLKKIRTALNKRRTFVCKANKALCQGANAHTLAVGTHKVKICDNYFAKTSQIERASIIVHEISHYKTQTNDKGAYETCSGVKPKASENFQRRAEYYEHIVECGLFIPK